MTLPTGTPREVGYSARERRMLLLEVGDPTLLAEARELRATLPP